MFYCYHTDEEYDLVESSISDMSDSDENELPYGNHKEVSNVLGEYRQGGIELEDFSK